MVSFRTLLSTLAILATAECSINWKPCNPREFDSSLLPVPFQCVTLDVPFDYTSRNSSEKLKLKLLKAPSPLKSKGTILFNLGGPGTTNRADFAGLAPTFIPYASSCVHKWAWFGILIIYGSLTGGQYDLVIFDTRGTVDTVPFSCYDDQIEEFRSFRGQAPANAPDTSVGTLWARAAADAEACLEHSAKNGSVITTAFVARDLISVVDALEEDGLLRYWGECFCSINTRSSMLTTRDTGRSLIWHDPRCHCRCNVP